MLPAQVPPHAVVLNPGNATFLSPIVAAQLGKEKAAPVADVRVVDPELMPVITQGQRLLEIARQRLEAAKMFAPCGYIQFAQPDPFRPPVVEEARRAQWKFGRFHRVMEICAQL